RVQRLSEAVARWTERRDGKGAGRTASEVVPDLPARLADVRDRIARAAARAGRDPSRIRLVAVSKTFSADRIRAAHGAGQVDFGENKVQEAQQKPRDLSDTTIRRH